MVRMPVPESHSHLFEYGLVAMLIDQALTERRSNSRRVPVPPLLALVATAGLGWIDEGNPKLSSQTESTTSSTSGRTPRSP